MVAVRSGGNGGADISGRGVHGSGCGVEAARRGGDSCSGF